MRFSPNVRQWLPWLVTAVALAYVVQTATEQDAWAALVAEGIHSQIQQPLWLVGLIAFLPLNLGLEITKWHALRQNPEKTWTKSGREVLYGALWALITPNRTGDAIARVALLPEHERAGGARAWAVGAWSQAGWTLTWGCVAALAICTTAAWGPGFDLQSPGGWALGTAALAAGWWALPGLLRQGKLARWSRRFPGLNEPLAGVKYAQQIGLSSARYLVFSSQFACALVAWGFEFDASLLVAIAAVYWGNMITPTAALAELGVREALVVAWFNPQTDALIPLLAATFSVWLVNLFLPACVGGVLHLMRSHG
jgi:hypothetical protein